MADDDTLKPWTIKSVPDFTRKLAMQCATKARENVAVWLTRAVENQAKLDAGQKVTPPAALAQPAPEVDLNGMAALIRAATEASTAAGIAPSKTTARHAAALVDMAARSARGLPPRLPRPRSLSGPVIEAKPE